MVGKERCVLPNSGAGSRPGDGICADRVCDAAGSGESEAEEQEQEVVRKAKCWVAVDEFDEPTEVTLNATFEGRMGRGSTRIVQDGRGFVSRKKNVQKTHHDLRR